MKKTALGLLCIAPLALSSCISKEQADLKLQEACLAGIASQLEEGYKVETVQEAAFSDAPSAGSDARKVNIKAGINDGFATDAQEYSCTFFTVFGPFNMSMNASIYQLQMPDGTIIGQDGLRAMGTDEQIDALNNAVSAVLDSK